MKPTTLALFVLFAVASRQAAQYNESTVAYYGFVVTSKFGVVPTKVSKAAQEAAIARALGMSKLYGPTSKEAELGWEKVEDIDASDNT
jgi:hypothetical protein